MFRRIASKKLLAVTTGSMLVLGGAALAASASDAPAGSTDVVISDPSVGSTIDDSLPGSEDQADVNDVNDDAVDDDQGETEDADQADVEDTNDDAVGDDQGQDGDDQGQDGDDQGENEDGDQADTSDDQGETQDVNDEAQDDQGSED